MQDAEPMEITPIDDGAEKNDGAVTIMDQTVTASEEEEARQAIDMLRGDDVSARVAAANRLEAVAAALGEERTREVSVVVMHL